MNLMTVPGETVFRFAAFRLDRRGGLARRREDGSWEPVPLGARGLVMLMVLVERRGELVTKQALMEVAWPDMAVEDSNLTVQMSALRRALDQGRAGGSCIQTVIGRGYRFLPAVTVEDDTPDPVGPPPESGETQAEPFQTLDIPVGETALGSRAPSRRLSPLLLTLAGALIAAGLALCVLLTWRGGTDSRTAQVTAPRLSIVVLPFQNLGGDPAEDYLVDGITDDLTTDLSHLQQAFVIAASSARAYKDKSVDVRRIGRELGVRYVVEGSVRRIGAALRVNAQLVSTETGAHLWSDRFDEPIADMARGQDSVLARMRGGLGISLVDIELARGSRERPATPDAFDLILRARSLLNQKPSLSFYGQAQALYERALTLDPNSIAALSGAGLTLIYRSLDDAQWGDPDRKARVEGYLARAREIAPASEETLTLNMYLSFAEQGPPETMAAARQLIERFPNSSPGYTILGQSFFAAGKAEEYIPLMQKWLRLNPRSPMIFQRIRHMGTASLLLGRDKEAIEYLEQSLAMNPTDTRTSFRQTTFRQLAAAHARTGQIEQARWALSEADRLWPFDTVRGHWPDGSTNPVYAAQIRRYQEGLRLAGERDHAEEDADFGVPPDTVLHSPVAGYTPTRLPGATTIRTPDLVTLIDERGPLLIDVLTNSWGRSLPGAVGLPNAGAGGSLSDTGQERLRRAMRKLAGGDLNRSIVAIGWNSECFDGRNLALRLLALGYTNVHWYRDGREAWEVAGLPESELVPREW